MFNSKKYCAYIVMLKFMIIYSNLDYAVPPNAISTTITFTELQPAVGTMYTLTCVVTINVMGLSQAPNVHWFHNGNEVSVVEDNVTTSTKVIRFSHLNTSHSGNYICSGNISSPASPHSVIVNQTRNITLQSKLGLVLNIHFLSTLTIILTEHNNFV